MTPNSLIAPLRLLLSRPNSRYTEYALIRALIASGDLPNGYAATSLGLFRTHFKLMNALYCLQSECALEGHRLKISPLEIYFEACTSDENRTQLTEVSVLREFYLDWHQYDAATDATIDSLLADFWRKFEAYGVSEDERDRALEVLGLVAPVEFTTIKQQYRRLVMAHHPDRGGDHKSLQEINQAMAVLSQVYCRN